MLSSISKTELTKHAKRMRATNDSLVPKKNPPFRVEYEQDEHTTSSFVFKRKRPKVAHPSEHSHLEG